MRLFEPVKKRNKLRFRVSVHPPSRQNEKYESLKKTESEVVEYVKKLEQWCRKKGASIVVELDDSVYYLMECDGKRWNKSSKIDLY